MSRPGSRTSFRAFSSLGRLSSTLSLDCCFSFLNSAVTRRESNGALLRKLTSAEGFFECTFFTGHFHLMYLGGRKETSSTAQLNEAAFAVHVHMQGRFTLNTSTGRITDSTEIQMNNEFCFGHCHSKCFYNWKVKPGKEAHKPSSVFLF